MKEKNDSLMNTENDNNDLKREAPLLFGITKKEPFEAPHNYFNQFSVDVSLSSNKTWWSFFKKPIFWMPAINTVLIVAFLFFKNDKNNVTDFDMNFTAYDLSEISFEELDKYVTNHLLAMNTGDVIDMVGEDEIPTIKVKMDIPKNSKKEETQINIDNISNDEMEDYILDNIDEYDLNNIY